MNAKREHEIAAQEQKRVFNEELQRPPTDDKRKMVYASDDERWSGVMGIFGELVTIIHHLAEHPSLGITRAQAETVEQHWQILQPHPVEKAAKKG